MYTYRQWAVKMMMNQSKWYIGAARYAWIISTKCADIFNMALVFLIILTENCVELMIFSKIIVVEFTSIYQQQMYS